MTRIATLTEDDWEELQEIRLAALRTDPEAFGSTLAREELFREPHWRMRLRSTPTLVALDDDGRAVGLVSVIQEPGSPEDDRHVVALWVRPEARRRGVGRELLVAICEVARATGARTVSLWVAAGNTGAARLYGALGFRPTGVVQALPSDPTRGEERWELVLNAV